MLSQADKTRGRFRTFLLTAVYRSVIQYWRQQNSQKRRPDNGWVDVDEHVFSEISTQSSPDFFLEAKWSLATLQKALFETRKECLKTDNQQMWAALWWLLAERTADGRSGGETYRSVLGRLGFTKEEGLRNALTQGQKKLRSHLRNALTSASFSPDESEEEWLRLRAILEDPKAWNQVKAAEIFAGVGIQGEPSEGVREIAHSPFDSNQTCIDRENLLTLVHGLPIVWSDQELREIWTEIWETTSPLSGDNGVIPGSSIGEHLQDPNTPLSTIRKLKETAKRSVKGNTMEFPKIIAQTIYHCCTAFPWVYGQASLSRLSVNEQVTGWQQALGQGWLSEPPRSLLEQAIQQTRKTSADETNGNA